MARPRRPLRSASFGKLPQRSRLAQFLPKNPRIDTKCRGTAWNLKKIHLLPNSIEAESLRGLLIGGVAIGAIDQTLRARIRSISALNAAEKEKLFFAPPPGTSRGVILAASGLPERVLRHVIEKGTLSEQLTLACNHSVAESVVRELADGSRYDTVRRQAQAALQDRALFVGGLSAPKDAAS